MTTSIDWDYVSNVIETTTIAEGAEDRREYLETRGFDVMSIIRGLAYELDKVTGDRAKSATIIGSIMAGMEMAMRVVESKELDEKIEQ